MVMSAGASDVDVMLWLVDLMHTVCVCVRGVGGLVGRGGMVQQGVKTRVREKAGYSGLSGFAARVFQVFFFFPFTHRFRRNSRWRVALPLFAPRRGDHSFPIFCFL